MTPGRKSPKPSKLQVETDLFWTMETVDGSINEACGFFAMKDYDPDTFLDKDAWERIPNLIKLWNS